MSALSRFWFLLRFATLAVSVMLALGLNHREVEVLHLPPIHDSNGVLERPQLAVIKHKVLLEATYALSHYVAPTAVAWLPAPVLATCWLPALRRALAVPRPRAGVRAGEFFRARLLARTMSPQAP